MATPEENFQSLIAEIQSRLDTATSAKTTLITSFVNDLTRNLSSESLQKYGISIRLNDVLITELTSLKSFAVSLTKTDGDPK